MPRVQGVLWTLAALVILAVPAAAQIIGRPVEVSGGAGWFSPDARARMKDNYGYAASLGWRWSPALSVEAQGLWGPTDSDSAADQTHHFSAIGLDLRWNLRGPEGRAVPYLLTGMAYGLSHKEDAMPARLARGAPSLGLGLLLNVVNQRTYLRVQVRDVMFRERNAIEFSHHWLASAGLQMNFGGKPKDQDFDGVRDWLDRCPNTPIGARVDAGGCPIDSDGDQVFDGLDRCEDTPAGCVVDKDGCPTDADGDGVCDGLDQCADTPKGATVDAKGCPSDADGDGVFDGLDQCANTPQGALVNDQGCPVDLDGDGVPDGLDRCDNTPAGLEVDKDGCPILVTEKETELLDTGMISLQDVNFETGKAEILPESFQLLDAVGTLLSRWPELKIEIGGHTDSRGSNAANQRLSEARARSVLEYLTGKFPMLKADQFTTKGYGESKPVVPNDSELNMAKNRRVEFVVQNKDVLRRETERRRLLREGETVPPDTTK